MSYSQVWKNILCRKSINILINEWHLLNNNETYQVIYNIPPNFNHTHFHLIFGDWSVWGQSIIDALFNFFLIVWHNSILHITRPSFLPHTQPTFSFPHSIVLHSLPPSFSLFQTTTHPHLVILIVSLNQ